MRVGVTGHQNRKGIDWSWVASTIDLEFRKLAGVSKGLSSLAAGTDQIFAEVALRLGIPVTAVLPLENYEGFFTGEALGTYRRLLVRCDIVRLHSTEEPERAFLRAGEFIVDNCDLLFAVWDGEKADGIGGTADVVRYAQAVGRGVLHINPFDTAVSRLG